MKNLKIILGLSLMTLGFISGLYYSAYFLLFSILIYACGSTLFLLSHLKLIYKLSIIIIPVLLFLPINSKINQLNLEQRKKNFILPENFSGAIRIYYGEDCGEISELSNYMIPADGILIMKEKDFYPIKYQFVIKSGKSTINIKETQLYTEKKPIPSVIFMMSEGNTSNGFHDYYIYNGEQHLKYNFLGNNAALDSLGKSKIKNCREE